MNAAAIANSNHSSTLASASGITRVPVQTLGQDDFLQLLVTQMTQQDPMSPMKDTEFIAQMAQFSSLEQSKAMSNDMSSLRASALLGNVVQVTNPDGSVASGTVSMVSIVKGVPQIVVNDNSYDLSAVFAIEPPSYATLNPNPATTNPDQPAGQTTPAS